MLLLGKDAFRKIVFGVDPGATVGAVTVSDGKVIEEGNCFSTKEVIDRIFKTIRNVEFSATYVAVKIGNRVTVYKELLEGLNGALPPQVVLEAVSERELTNL